MLLSVLLLVSCKPNDQQKSIDAIFQTVCSAEEALELARQTDTVVFEQQGCTSGNEVWNTFIQNVNAETPACVLCANYYVLDKARMSEALYEQEKAQYPKLFFCLVTYDGKEYHVKSRESTAESPDYQESFPFLLHFTGEAPATALYSAYDRYVLVDDPSVTWEDIEAGLFSSQSGAEYHHFTVYQDFSGWIGKPSR